MCRCRRSQQSWLQWNSGIKATRSSITDIFASIFATLWFIVFSARLSARSVQCPHVIVRLSNRVVSPKLFRIFWWCYFSRCPCILIMSVWSAVRWVGVRCFARPFSHHNIHGQRIRCWKQRIPGFDAKLVDVIIWLLVVIRTQTHT